MPHNRVGYARLATLCIKQKWEKAVWLRETNARMETYSTVPFHFIPISVIITYSISKTAKVATTDLENLDVHCGETLHTNNTALYNFGACYYSEMVNEDGLLDFEKFPNCELNYVGD